MRKGLNQQEDATFINTFATDINALKIYKPNANRPKERNWQQYGNNKGF